jgi:hypothetical protein
MRTLLQHLRDRLVRTVGAEREVPGPFLDVLYVLCQDAVHPTTLDGCADRDHCRRVQGMSERDE